MKNHPSRRPDPSRDALAALLAVGAVLAPMVAAAQETSGPTVLVRSSVKGAAPSPQPAADTPVAPQYQQSYQAWLKMKAAAKGGTRYTRATYAKMPDWSGVWTREGGFNWQSPPQVAPEAAAIGPEAAQAILAHCKSFPCKGWVEADLTPEYAKKYLEKTVGVAHGYEWDQLSNCLPTGFPRFLLNPFYREFTATPDETWLSQETQGEYRRIYTDGRGHVAEDDGHPLWEGDSIGFWDGDTLVVHTIRMRAEQLQRNMPIFSEDISTVERIRMVDPNTIEDDATIYDPKAPKTPWRGVHRYVRVTAPVARLDMWSCEENNNVVQTETGGSTFILPGEPGYKDPSNIQNIATDKAIAYGARIMAEEAAAKKAAGK
ncbi:MAG TPA: hypothetical protein VL358_11580 [Caulobacteraceae bacterium]|jgi:hypothetical protein|nr:hypothetical protein [Caulobacteraceae bacterium]